MCQGQHGLFLKIVQFLGNKELTLNELKSWQSNLVPVINREEVQRKLIDIFGSPLEQTFLEVSDEYYPASIAQVIRAKHIKYGDVAIKIKYPHIKETIKDQLAFLGLLPKLSRLTSVHKWGVDFGAYQTFLEETLEHELNFELEAKNQRDFHNIFKDNSNIGVPEVFTELSTHDVLVQQFINGISFEYICAHATKDEKQVIAESLFQSLIIPLFQHCKLHIDPNPFNYIFTKNKIYMIDFGQVQHFSIEFVSALKELWECLDQQKEVSPLKYFVALGFDEKKLFHFKEELPVVAEVLFRPFLADYKFNLRDWNYEEHLHLILGENLWWFRSAGGTAFFTLMKTFAAIKEMINSLGVDVYYRKYIELCLKEGNFNWKTIKNVETNSFTTFNSKAKHILISVKKEGVERVKLTMPIAGLLDLPSYLEEEVKEKLVNRGIIIENIIRDSIHAGVIPGDIFKLVEGTSVYHIWLE